MIFFGHHEFACSAGKANELPTLYSFVLYALRGLGMVSRLLGKTYISNDFRAENLKKL